MATVSYPVDTTGTSATNRVTDEPHVLSEINDDTKRVIIPDFAPFYQDNHILRHTGGVNGSTTLIRGVDYDLVMPYMDASRSIGKFLFGGITIHTDLVQGQLALTYQTLGGPWVADKNYVLEQILQGLYNPRTIYFDQISNVQDKFPPVNHQQDFDTVYGQKALIDAVMLIRDAVAAGPNPNSPFIQHLTARGNVHEMTPEDIGLGLVPNFPQASDLEVTNRALVDKLITLRQLFDLGIIPDTVNLQPVYDQMDIRDTATRQSAIEAAEARITRESLLVDQVANLPLATSDDVQNQTPAQKYLTLEQAIALVGLMRPVQNTQPELLTAAQYFLQRR